MNSRLQLVVRFQSWYQSSMLHQTKCQSLAKNLCKKSNFPTILQIFCQTLWSCVWALGPDSQLWVNWWKFVCPVQSWLATSDCALCPGWLLSIFTWKSTLHPDHWAQPAPIRPVTTFILQSYHNKWSPSSSCPTHAWIMKEKCSNKIGTELITRSLWQQIADMRPSMDTLAALVINISLSLCFESCDWAEPWAQVRHESVSSLCLLILIIIYAGLKTSQQWNILVWG